MPNPTLPGAVKKATPGLDGFDINSPLTQAQAQTLKDAGRDFCIRYIPRTSKPSDINLTNAEALILLNAGLALMPVQHASPEGWTPTTNLGTQYGNYAATYAKEIGLPPGINIWCDLEMVADDTTAAAVIAYCHAWYAAVHTSGYIPGLYVGYGIKLTDQQLYDDLSFQHYWRAYNGQPVATRGFQVIQSDEIKVKGITIGPDHCQNDELGGVALWLAI